MKKFVFAAAGLMALVMSSCGIIDTRHVTATDIPVSNVIATASIADLDVSNRVEYTYNTTESERRGGTENCKRAAIAALLKANGNADVLVAPEFKYSSDNKVIEVSGRPAKYKNFRSAQ